MRFKGILLDIDNTLYDYDPTHAVALEAVMNEMVNKFGLNEEDARRLYERARSEVHARLSGTASSHNRLLYFQRMFEILKINPLERALGLYRLYWERFLENMSPCEGIYDFLGFVKTLKICLVSDLTADIQYRKIEKLKLFVYTNLLVTSEEAGREKPHPAFFKCALGKIGLPSSEICMIGDDYERDMMGAAKLGIRSFWLNRSRRSIGKRNKLITQFTDFVELKEHFE